MVNNRDRGILAEEKAKQFLLEKGFQFLEKNFRWRGGEIDLIMLDPQNALVFVEVRSATKRSQHLKYSIGPAKRRRLLYTAELYCSKASWARKMPRRFDWIWIEEGQIEHWKNIII
jgi:putative endonuclease